MALPSTPMSLRGALARLVTEGYTYIHVPGWPNLSVPDFTKLVAPSMATTVRVVVVTSTIVAILRMVGGVEMYRMSMEQIP